VAVVQALLEAYPEAAKVKNKDGRTPADEAAKCNRNAEVKAFFASGQHLQATPGQSAAAAAKAAADKAAAAKAHQDAEDAQLAAAIAASLNVSGHLTD
jgi:hypothetical protein